MAVTRPDPRTDPDATVDGVRPSIDRYASDDGPADNASHPRLIEEHHVIGPHGEDEIEATDERGRRWYQLRPEPRRRADLIGFNYTCGSRSGSCSSWSCFSVGPWLGLLGQRQQLLPANTMRILKRIVAGRAMLQ